MSALDGIWPEASDVNIIIICLSGVLKSNSYWIPGPRHALVTAFVNKPQDYWFYLSQVIITKPI